MVLLLSSFNIELTGLMVDMHCAKIRPIAINRTVSRNSRPFLTYCVRCGEADDCVCV
jgi:hypothetical protein